MARRVGGRVAAQLEGVGGRRRGLTYWWDLLEESEGVRSFLAATGWERCSFFGLSALSSRRTSAAPAALELSWRRASGLFTGEPRGSGALGREW